jgi:hypothetical protein
MRPEVPPERTDISLVANALGTMIDMFESLDEADDLDPEDKALVLYCKRVHDAANAGNLDPIRKELDADDAAEEAAHLLAMAAREAA